MAALPLESFRSCVRVAVSRALAEALIDGLYHAAEEGHSLTQLQQIDMATMAMMAAHTAITRAETEAETEAEIRAEVANLKKAL